MLVGLAIARFISPSDYGIWGTLNLILTYGVIFQSGIINGLNLELPLAIGANNLRKANDLVKTAQYFIVVCIALIFVSGFFIVKFFPISDKKFYYGTITIIIMLGFTFYQDFLTATFRTQQSFRKLSYINLVHALVNLVTILLIVYYSYYGLLIKSILVLFSYVVFLHYFRPFKVNVQFDKKLFFVLIKVGMPIFLLAYMQAAALSFDRVLLIKYTDNESVGLYSFAYLAFSSITLFSSSVASYIYPTMSENYAKDNNPGQLWLYLKKNMLLIFFGLLVIAVFGVLIVPFLIKFFFPAYVKSIPAMKILFFAGVFNGSVIGVNVLLSMKKWKLIIVYHTIFSVLLVVCPLIFINVIKDKIEGVAYGVMVANVINLITGYYLVYIATGKKIHGRK